jgi:hypothetical protein
VNHRAGPCFRGERFGSLRVGGLERQRDHFIHRPDIMKSKPFELAFLELLLDMGRVLVR